MRNDTLSRQSAVYSRQWAIFFFVNLCVPGEQNCYFKCLRVNNAASHTYNSLSYNFVSKTEKERKNNLHVCRLKCAARVWNRLFSCYNVRIMNIGTQCACNGILRLISSINNVKMYSNKIVKEKIYITGYAPYYNECQNQPQKLTSHQFCRVIRDQTFNLMQSQHSDKDLVTDIKLFCAEILSIKKINVNHSRILRISRKS